MVDLFENFIEGLEVSYTDVFIAKASVPGVPVSVNKLYSVFRGKKALNKAGKAFRDRLSSAVAMSSMDWKRANEIVYQGGGGASLLIALYFEDLRNLSWKPGGITKTGIPQNPVQRRDATNYIKLVEDAVSLGSGIDDCNNEYALVRRGQDTANPRTEITYVVYNNPRRNP